MSSTKLAAAGGGAATRPELCKYPDPLMEPDKFRDPDVYVDDDDVCMTDPVKDSDVADEDNDPIDDAKETSPSVAGRGA